MPGIFLKLSAERIALVVTAVLKNFLTSFDYCIGGGMEGKEAEMLNAMNKQKSSDGLWYAEGYGIQRESKTAQKW